MSTGSTLLPQNSFQSPASGDNPAQYRLVLLPLTRSPIPKTRFQAAENCLPRRHLSRFGSRDSAFLLCSTPQGQSRLALPLLNKLVAISRQDPARKRGPVPNRETAEDRTMKIKAVWNKFAIAAALISQLAAAPCFSSIPRDGNGDWYSDWSRVIEPVESVRVIKPNDVAMWIPTNMQPTGSGSQVASQIFDFGMSNLMKSPEFKNNSVVRSAQSLESVMASDLSLGGEDGDTKHVFKFRMKPAQTSAQLGYQGFITARLNYHIGQESLNVEISEKVVGDTDLVLSHADTRDDRREMLSMRWNF